MHLLGGFARSRDDDASANAARTRERLEAMKRSQKSTDSIVARAAKLCGLQTNQSGLKALYWLGKSIGLIQLVTSQFAPAAAERSDFRSRSDGDSLRSALLRATNDGSSGLSSARHVTFSRDFKIEDAMVAGALLLNDSADAMEPGDRSIELARCCPPMDLACGPRREGGSASFRIGARARERFSVLSANGGAHIAGLQSSGVTLYKAMAPVIAAPQLFHPSLVAMYTHLFVMPWRK